MFVAVVPPEEVLEHLGDALERLPGPGDGLRWSAPEQWHLTLAFLPEVAEHRLEELADRLARAATRRTPLRLAVRGSGAFSRPARARVLYAGVAADGQTDGQTDGEADAEVDGAARPAGVAGVEELRRTATGARAAANKAGAAAAGGRFHPHLTLARTRHPRDLTPWVAALEGYRGPAWTATEVALVESRLGEGPARRPRYETRETFALGRRRG